MLFTICGNLRLEVVYKDDNLRLRISMLSAVINTCLRYYCTRMTTWSGGCRQRRLETETVNLKWIVI
jgi:hypothetical protein